MTTQDHTPFPRNIRFQSTFPPSFLNLPCLPSSSPLTICLEADNYIEWRNHLHHILIAYGIDAYVFGDKRAQPSPTLSNGGYLNIEFLQWTRINSLLCSWILGSISPYYASVLVGKLTAAEMIQSLETTRIMELQLQLCTQKKEGQKMIEYLMKIKFIADQLAAVGHPVSNKSLKLCALDGLGPKYTPLVKTVMCRIHECTLEEIHSFMVKNEFRFEELPKTDLPGNAPSAAFLTSAVQNNVSNFSTSMNSGFLKTQLSVPQFQTYALNSQHGRSFSPCPKWNLHSFLQNKNTLPKAGRSTFPPEFVSPQQSQFGDSRPQCQICFKKGHAAAECFKIRDIIMQFQTTNLSSTTNATANVSNNAVQSTMTESYMANNLQAGPPSVCFQPPYNIHLTSNSSIMANSSNSLASAPIVAGDGAMQGRGEAGEKSINSGGSYDRFGNFRGFGSGMKSSIMGGKDPFDDPFFTRPLGSMFGRKGSFEDPPNIAKSKGPLIEEFNTDDEDNEGGDDAEGGGNDDLSKNPLVIHPDDIDNADRTDNTFRNKQEGKKPSSRSVSFQRVTHGGINGAYYTATTTRRTGSDGVVLEDSKQADITTGQATHRISRGIDDKGHSVTRKLDSDGKVETLQTLHNLNEDELVEFEQAWKGNAESHLRGWDDGFNFHRNAGASIGRATSIGWALPYGESSGRDSRERSNSEARSGGGGRPKKVVTIKIE